VLEIRGSLVLCRVNLRLNHVSSRLLRVLACRLPDRELTTEEALVSAAAGLQAGPKGTAVRFNLGQQDASRSQIHTATACAGLY
jgi:hypothetical protein